MRSIRLFLASLVVISPLSGAWLSDLGAAQKLAGEQKKDLLVVFTSVASSGPCQQLERRVLSRESFQSLVKEKYLLVRIDVPVKGQDLTAVRNLAGKFGVNGVYPTTFYLDQMARPYHWETGVRSGGPEEYAKHTLEQVEKRKALEQAIAEADSLDGMERARAIVALLTSFPDQLVESFYAEELQELARLDPGDSLGYRKKKEEDQAYAEFEDAVKAVFHKDRYGEVIALVDDFMENHEPEGELRQKVLFRKLAALNHGGQIEPAILVAEEIILLAPKSSHGRFASQIKGRLEERRTP